MLTLIRHVGIGKTALIKAIVQTSDAIVHVDPITPPPQPLILGSRRARSKAAKPTNATNQISEISASTKPYPEWWSDLDDSRLLKRRKSLGGDTILDRNVCFIDTPGYSDGSSVSSKNPAGVSLDMLTCQQSLESITPVVRYVESHFEKVQSHAPADSEMLSMLGGDGGNQVDVVLYLIQNSIQPTSPFESLEFILLTIPQDLSRSISNTCSY